MKKFLITLFIIILLPVKTLAENINVVFTIDNNYPVFTLLVINSILQNNESNSKYKFYIIENDMTSKNKKKMSNYIQMRNQEVEFIHFDTSIIDNGEFFYTFSKSERESQWITRIAMARILMADLLPKNIDRVLYLDGDILVTGDIRELYYTDLGKNLAGMVLQFGFEQDYYNSGVILADLKKWRDENISEQMLEFLENNKTRFIYEKPNSNSFLYPDQDLINNVLATRIKQLPNKWNNQVLGGYMMESINLSIIIHYLGAKKPWDYTDEKHPAYVLYRSYWNKSGLIKYKFYYAIKRIKKEYLKIINYKIDRFYRTFSLDKSLHKGR